MPSAFAAPSPDGRRRVPLRRRVARRTSAAAAPRSRPLSLRVAPRSRSPRDDRRFSTETVLGSRVQHYDFDAVCVLASQTGPFVWVGGMHGGSNLSALILDRMHVQYVVPCKNFKGRVRLDSDRHRWMQGADMLFDHAKPEDFFEDCLKLFSDLIFFGFVSLI